MNLTTFAHSSLLGKDRTRIAAFRAYFVPVIWVSRNEIWLSQASKTLRKQALRLTSRGSLSLHRRSRCYAKNDNALMADLELGQTDFMHSGAKCQVHAKAIGRGKSLERRIHRVGRTVIA